MSLLYSVRDSVNIPLLLSSCRIIDNAVIRITYHARNTIGRSIIETLINLVTSLVLVNILGIYGVLLGTITAFAALKVMKESGVDIRPLRRFVIIFLVGITVFGGLMHRSFLLLWILGLFLGYTIISKSFREKSFLTAKRIFLFLGLAVAGFLGLEVISRLTGMTIFSPMLRLSRLEQYSLSSVKMVLNNIQLIGHSGNASYWGAEGTAFAEGYITLPMQLILFFGLPFPMFFGILVNQKDTVDYMLPGLMG